jgi:hypothetical protein
VNLRQRSFNYFFANDRDALRTYEVAATRKQNVRFSRVRVAETATNFLPADEGTTLWFDEWRCFEALRCTVCARMTNEDPGPGDSRPFLDAGWTERALQGHAIVHVLSNDLVERPATMTVPR